MARTSTKVRTKLVIAVNEKFSPFRVKRTSGLCKERSSLALAEPRRAGRSFGEDELSAKRATVSDPRSSTWRSHPPGIHVPLSSGSQGWRGGVECRPDAAGFGRTFT